jgi:hypothetical protein
MPNRPKSPRANPRPSSSPELIALTQQIQVAEKNVAELRTAYLLRAVEFLERWYPSRAKQLVMEHPKRAESLGMERLAKLKTEVTYMSQRSEILVAQYLSAVPFFEEPERALMGLRKACAQLALLFSKYGFQMEFGNNAEIYRGDLLESQEMQNLRKEFLKEKPRLDELLRKRSEVENQTKAQFIAQIWDSL